MRPYASTPNLKLYCTDATQGLALLQEQSVQTCVTSPPYFALRDYGVPDQFGLEATPNDYVHNLVTVLRDVRRVLRHDGTLWLNLGDSYARNPAKGQHKPGDPGKQNYIYQRGGGRASATFDLQRSGLKEKDLIGIPWHAAHALQQPWLLCTTCDTENHASQWGSLHGQWRLCPTCETCTDWEITEPGWYLRADIIWHKPNAMPEPVKDRPVTDHEHIFLLSKSPKYYYDHEILKEPGANGKPRSGRMVWSINTTPAYKRGHFAAFPQALAARMVQAGAPKGSVVLDPFLGSATTALAALQHERKIIGIELNPQFCALACERLNVTAPCRPLEASG